MQRRTTGSARSWAGCRWRRRAAQKLDDTYFAEPVQGLRHLNHTEADPDWLVRPTVVDGLRVLEERGLVFEVVAIHPLHLGHVPRLARACPSLPIVVDHLAKPPILSGDYGAWKADLRQPPGINVTPRSRPQHGRSRRGRGGPAGIVGFALEVFGPKRLMFGSDWPVAILAGDYARVWRETNAVLDSLAVSAGDRAAILGDNAASLYSIGAAS
jgi:L-fuconolactonase